MALGLKKDILAEIDMGRITSKKSATRAELFKRLTIARSFMEDNALCPVTIDQIAFRTFLRRSMDVFRRRWGKCYEVRETIRILGRKSTF